MLFILKEIGIPGPVGDPGILILTRVRILGVLRGKIRDIIRGIGWRC